MTLEDSANPRTTFMLNIFLRWIPTFFKILAFYNICTWQLQKVKVRERSSVWSVWLWYGWDSAAKTLGYVQRMLVVIVDKKVNMNCRSVTTETPVSCMKVRNATCSFNTQLTTVFPALRLNVGNECKLWGAELQPRTYGHLAPQSSWYVWLPGCWAVNLNSRFHSDRVDLQSMVFDRETVVLMFLSVP